MTQVLMCAAAYQRIATALEGQLPQVEPVLWHSDGTLTSNGQAVSATHLSPRAAWISGDVLDNETLVRFADTLLELPSLAWAQSANAGLDHPVYRRLTETGLVISKSGAQSIAIAEFVLTYALAYSQDLYARWDAQCRAHWQPRLFDELWQSRWLIVGYGHIGRNVAQRVKAFDGHTTVVRRRPGADGFADRVISLEAITEHVPNTDIVVLAVPATADTRGLVDSAFLHAMREDSLLINVARGSLVDETALLESLPGRRPGHAVLDVFETEPLPAEHPFWRHPQVTVTSHTSNAGRGTRARGDRLFLDNLKRFLSGEVPSDIASA